jgi:hypothetical protein
MCRSAAVRAAALLPGVLLRVGECAAPAAAVVRGMGLGVRLRIAAAALAVCC